MSLDSPQAVQVYVLQGMALSLVSGFLARAADGWWVAWIGGFGLLSMATPPVCQLRATLRSPWYAWWLVVFAAPALIAAVWWRATGHDALAWCAYAIVFGHVAVALVSNLGLAGRGEH